MLCTVTNVSKVAQTVFPADGRHGLAPGLSFTGEFTAERVDEMQRHQPGKFVIAIPIATIDVEDEADTLDPSPLAIDPPVTPRALPRKRFRRGNRY